MASANPWLSGAGFDAYRSAGWRYLGLVAVFLVLAVEVVAKAGGAGTPQAASAPNLTSYINKPVPASLLTTLKTASQDGLKFKGGPALLSVGAKLPGAKAAPKGPATVYYYGADFCPYCAAERWATVVTLLRFGSLSGLQYMMSNPNDVFPNTPTFTFATTKVQSPYLAFNEAEVANRTDTAAFQKPSPALNAAFTAYNTAKYVGAAAGDIPFLDVANRYEWVGAPYRPSQLKGVAWATIAKGLVSTARSGKGQSNYESILRTANLFSAAICSTDGGRPASVCTAPGVVAAKGDLPK